ncbi:MAG: thioredoxin domain-containing protein [Verrucomicrobiota bacterium]
MDKGLFIVVAAIAGIILFNLFGSPKPFDGESVLIQIQPENFEAEVLGSPVPVVANFSATWCGPCNQIAPTVERLAVELDGKVRVAKIDVDKNPGIADKYGVRGIPDFIVFKDGEPRGKIRPGNLESMIVQASAFAD